MGSPSERTSEASKDIVPLNPRSGCDSTWLLLKETRFIAGDSACCQKDKRQQSQNTRGHLRHDGAKNLGRRVFTFPVHVLGHVKRNTGLNRGDKGSPGFGAHQRCGHKSGRHDDENRKDYKTQLGHDGKLRVHNDAETNMLAGDTLRISTTFTAGRCPSYAIAAIHMFFVLTKVNDEYDVGDGRCEHQSPRTDDTTITS
jgi:hypothetical protein